MQLVDPGKTPTANFSVLISCVEDIGKSLLVFVLLQVLGMGLSGQVRIRRNRKIASYLLRLANQSVVVSAHIGKN